jgi:dehypoxanthine futalosine cyclase
VSPPREVQAVVRALARGERLSAGQAMTLYADADLHTLGELAHAARLARHPGPVVTYVVDRNINYSNVCVCACKFCAYYRQPGAPDAFVLTPQELAAKIEETLALGGTQILMQGGHHPDLPLGFYEDMLREIKSRFAIHIHAFSPPEIVHFAQISGLSTAAVIARLKAAGLDSIPGGGAEILVDRVRREVSPNKCPAGQWLAVMAEAHGQGLKTTATMMLGHRETASERIRHLLAVRELQDETGGFTAFIPWTFAPANTALAGIRPETSVNYLRLLAVARLVLDNVDNLQVSWVTMGPEVAQLALFFGANDFGSTMIEENVVAAAGVRHRLSVGDVRRVIADAGFVPRQRTMDYTLLEGAA